MQHSVALFFNLRHTIFCVRWKLNNLVNKTNLVHNLFLIYLPISACFGRLCALHQGIQLCFCDTWYFHPTFQTVIHT
jgi:hypothetical protein